MSTTIDQKVVEMKFDNRQFESGVRESMSTLDKLKQALNFNKTTTGLETISKDVNKIDMSGLASATEEVSKKFSALEIIAITTLVNITNSAVNAGKALIKSMSIDQLTAGWTKFEQKTTAVQTILSATRMQFDDEAKQLAVVNAKLKELNWFTDETSYNFTDMVSNIGKFTSAGVDLDTAAKSMQGIATWAAMSGANAVTASRAMYNLAQAIGVGYVKLIDWKTIENCNMATMEFKQTVLETAVELGTLKKEADGVYKTVAKGTKVTAEAFSESLSEGWFTNDVLTASLNVYEKATDKLHEMADKYELTATEILGAFDEYKESAENIDVITEGFKLSGDAAKDFAEDLEILNSEEYELSISAFKAAQQAKTFTDVIDATKDAVSTGWMQTFEYIFGNYHEAVALFSDLCEVFWELFASGAEARNAMLELWHAVGGRETLLNGIYKAFSNIKMVMDAVKEVWDEFFGKENWEKAAGLLKVSDYIEVLFKWLEPTEKELSNIQDIFRGLFSVLDLFGTVLKKILKTIFPMVSPARSLFDIVLEIGGALGRLVNAEMQVAKITVENSSLLDLIGKGLRKFLIIVGFIITKIIEFIDKCNVSNKITKVISVAVNILATAFKILGIAVSFAVTAIIGFIKLVKTVTESIVYSFKQLTARGVNGFKAALIIAKEALINFLDSLKNVPILGKAIEKLSYFLSILKEKLSSVTSDKNKISDFFYKIGESIKVASEALGKFIAFLVNVVKNLNPVKVLLGIMVASIAVTIYRIGKAVDNATKGIPNLMISITRLFDMLHDKFKPRFIKISVLQLAASIAILAASLYLIANGVDQNRLWECIGAVAALAGIIILLTSAAAGLTLALEGLSRDRTTMITVGAGVFALAASVLVLAEAMRVLNEVKLEGIWERLGILAAIAVGLAVISIALSKLAPTMSKDSWILLAFAVSIASMVKSLKTLAELDRNPEELQRLVTTLIELMAGLSMLAFASRSIGLFSAVGLITLVLTFKMVLPMLDELIQHDYSKIKKAIDDNIEIFFSMVALASIMTVIGALFGKSINKFGIGLIMMAASIAILVKVMKSMQDINPDKFMVAFTTIENFLSMFALLMILSSYTEKAQPLKFATSLLIISLAVSILADISTKLSDVDSKSLIIGETAILVLLGMVALLEKLSEKATNISGVAKVLTAISFIAIEMAIISLIDWKDLLTSAAAMSLVMYTFGKTLTFVTKPNWKDIDIKSIIAVAGSCALLGFVLASLAEQKWERIAMSGAAMGMAMYTFGYVLNTISSSQGFNDTKRCLKKVLSAIGIASSIAILGLVMSDLAKNDWGSITFACVAMLACLVAFSKSLNFLSSIKNKNLEGYKTILAISAELVAVGLSLSLLTEYDWHNIIPSLIAMGSALVYLFASTGIMALFGKVKINKDAYKNILAVSVLLLAVGGLVKLLSTIPWPTINKESLIAIGAISGVALLVAFLGKFSKVVVNFTSKAAKKITSATHKQMLGTSAIIFSMCGMLASLAFSFKMVADTISVTNPLDVISAFSIINGSIVALAVAVHTMSKVGKLYQPKSFAMILAMASVIVAMAGAMKMLSDIEWNPDTVYSLSSMLIMLYVLKDLLAATSLLNGVKISDSTMIMLISLCTLILTFGYTADQLTKIGWPNVINALAAIAVVYSELLIVVMEMLVISKFVTNINAMYGIIAVCGVLVAVSTSLGMISNETSWKHIGDTLGAIFAVFIELSVVVLEMMALSRWANNASGYLGILSVCGVLLTVSGVLSILSYEVSWTHIGDVLGAIAAVFIELLVVVAEMAGLSKFVKNTSAYLGILTICALLISIGATLAILTEVTSWYSVMDALGALSGTILMLSLVIMEMAAISKWVKSNNAFYGILTACAMLLTISTSLWLISTMPYDTIGWALVEFTAIIGELTLVVLGLTYLLKGLKGPDIVMEGLGLIAPLIAMAVSLKLLSSIADSGDMLSGILGLAAVSALLIIIVGVMSYIGPVADVSFPLVAVALMALVAGFAVITLLDWDEVEYGFTKMLLMAGAIAAIGAILAGFAAIAAGVAASIVVAIGVIVVIAASFGVAAGIISLAAIGFATATKIMAEACFMLQMVNWDYLGSSIPIALLALSGLALVMALFSATFIGNLTILPLADALNTLSHIAYNDLSSVCSVASVGLIHLAMALDAITTSDVKILTIIVNNLISLSNASFKGIGTDLIKIAYGLTAIINAISEYSKSNATITDIVAGLLYARNSILNLTAAYEESARRIEKANARIKFQSSILGSFFNSGLVKGLVGGAKTVYSTFATIANNGIQSFASEAEIESPSRRMMQMGYFLMQGVSVGAIQESANTYKTMSGISDNTVKAASLDNNKMYQLGAESIKSQNKGMIDASKASARVITNINKSNLEISGRQVSAGQFKIGVSGEEAKFKGVIAASPDTVKGINNVDKKILELENDTYDEGYGIVGETGGAAAAEGVATGTSNNSDLFLQAGGLGGGNWYQGFKAGLENAKAGVKDFGEDLRESATDFGNTTISGFSAAITALGRSVANGEDFFEAYDEEFFKSYRNMTATSNEFWSTAKTGATGVSNVLNNLNFPSIDDFLNDTTGLDEYQKKIEQLMHDQEYIEVRWGQTKEWQEEYQKALEEGNTKRAEELGRSAGTLVEISKYSEDYYRIMGEGNDVLFDSDALTKELEKTLEDFGKTSGLAGEEVDEFTQNVKTLHDTIEGQIDTWNEFDRTIDITSEDLIKNLQSQISGVNEWSNKLLVLAQKGISKGILEELANMGPQGFKYVEAFIQMTGDELATVNDLWVEKGTLSTSSTLAIQAAYALAGDEASKAYVEGLGVNLEQVQNAAQQLGDSLAIEATPEALRAIDAYKEEFKSLYDSIESSIDIFEKFNMETETSSEEILENMKSQIEGVTKWSENLRILGERGISDGLLKELSALGPDGYDKVNAFVEMSQAQLEEANDLYAQSLELPSDATANVLSGYAQAGDESAKAFIEALGASVSDVDQIGTYILQGLELGLFDAEAATSLATTANNVGLGIIQQLMTATDSHSPSEKAREIGIWVDQGLRNGLKEASVLPKEEALHMGDMIISGLRQGIENGRSGVVESMINVARSAIEAAEATLAIRSPSRVFAEIGRYVDEGFAQGINQNAQAVADSAENMSYSSIDIVKDAIAHARDLINGDIDNTITLTPVLDLTNVRAGVQQINGMMNASSVSANVTGENSDSTGKNQNGGMTFIQNNYSPKALNRIDIYRQTKNQFAAMKGLVSGT